MGSQPSMNAGAAEIGPLRVTEVTSPAGQCVRTARQAGPADAGWHQVEVLVRGRLSVEQAGRISQLRPGDLVVVDPARPARYTRSAAEHVTVLVPRAMLPLRPAEVLPHLPVYIPGDQGTGALASTLIRQLPRHMEDYQAAEAAQLGTAVADLLAVALASRLDRARDLPQETRQAALLRRIYAFIDRHLHDPQLSPATVATAHHISLRYLHLLFGTQEVTVADWIRRRRLDRCRRDLLDPSQRARPAGAIGARWGLPNTAHFNRVFKAAYGLPPARYRLLADALPR